MANNSPPNVQGKTISLQTSATPSTSQSRVILPTDFGMGNLPAQVRIVNNGTGDVWISMTPASATAVIPTPGTTTVGTPQAVFRLKPGAIETFTCGGGPALFVNDISTVASQVYDLTPGEGL